MRPLPRMLLVACASVIARLLALQRKFPATRFATIADDAATLQALSAAAIAARTQIEVLLDLDCGMHRTGAAP